MTPINSSTSDNNVDIIINVNIAINGGRYSNNNSYSSKKKKRIHTIVILIMHTDEMKLSWVHI